MTILLHDQLTLKKEDHLFLLGDYVHRGPDSEGVIETIIHLQEQGYPVHAIMGNHEEMYIDDDLREFSPKAESWIRNLPFYLETVDYYFVHAGFNYDRIDPLEDKRSMIWGAWTNTQPSKEFLQGKKVVHGHEIFHIELIKEAIRNDDALIPLDNGCYKGSRGDDWHGLGNLCALDLDTLELHVQEYVG